MRGGAFAKVRVVTNGRAMRMWNLHGSLLRKMVGHDRSTRLEGHIPQSLLRAAPAG